MPGVGDGEPIRGRQIGRHDGRGESAQRRAISANSRLSCSTSRLWLFWLMFLRTSDLEARENSATEAPWPETSATTIRVISPPPQSVT